MKEILMIVFICSFTAALFGLMHFRRRYFLLYQNVQKFVKNILDGEEIPSHIPAEGDETVIQDLFIRISKKYNKETLAAMKEKEVIQGLISDLSHQLKTPLSNIRLYQDLLKSSSLSLQKKMQLEKRLDDAHITANKNTIPNDPRSPFVTSGVRLGTPAVTSRGMVEEDMEKIAEIIALVIESK